MKKWIYGTSIVVFIMSVLMGCGSSESQEVRNECVEEDREAKRMLQGIWVDEETETVLFRMKGDSLYYPDTTDIPLKFCVVADTLYLQGTDTVAYPIEKIGEHIFRFHAPMGDLVSLVRSDDPNDTAYFTHRCVTPLVYNEVEKKDSVVFYGGERYHCYVYVNPSKLKVYKTSYTSEGIAVENVYYDNVIHICLYKGKQRLFSRDYSKKSFSGMVPDAFLEQAILSDVSFVEADRDGCHFHATLSIPDEAGCYMADVCVGYDGQETGVELIEY